ncbi:MAG: hypothetical protein ACE14P_13395, partial [Methanotrichaceae archaeon]
MIGELGRDDHSNFPPGLIDKPVVGSNIRKTISAGRVLDLDSDVVSLQALLWSAAGPVVSLMKNNRPHPCLFKGRLGRTWN